MEGEVEIEIIGIRREGVRIVLDGKMLMSDEVTVVGKRDIERMLVVGCTVNLQDSYFRPKSKSKFSLSFCLDN